MNRVGAAPFFLRNDWLVCLWLPVVGIFGAIVEILFFGQVFESLDPSRLRFIYNLVFLNATHLIFPFVLLATVPEFRQLFFCKLKGKSGVGNLLIVLSTFLVISLMLVVQKGWIFTFAKHNTESIFFWIWILLPTIHGLRQSGGLGILYSKAIYNEAATQEKESLANFQKNERSILFFLYTTTLLALVVQGAQGQGIHLHGLLIPLLFCFPAGCAFYLFFKIQKVEALAKTDKLLFSLRMLFWPMAGYSWVAKLFIGIIHGHEYIALIQKMMSRSHASVYGRLLRFASFFLFLLFLYNGIELFTAYQGDNVDSFFSMYPPLLTLTLLVPILSLSHYLVDGVLYRIRDQDVKNNILPLIQGLIKSR